MFGAPGSAGFLTEVSQRLLQNLKLRCQRVQCIRVGNAEIPDNKPLGVALQRIHGIGRKRAYQLLADLSIVNKYTRDLTGLEINSLRQEVSKYLIGEDLKRCTGRDLKRLTDMHCYRGYRHIDLLPCRGQRTHTNGRTRKEHTRRRPSW